MGVVTSSLYPIKREKLIRRTALDTIGIVYISPGTGNTMKVFLLYLFTIVVVHAAPNATESDERKLQRVILEEIIQSVNDLKDILKVEVRLVF